jgi:hypothetical protein
MANENIWLRTGHFIDSDLYAEFAMCRTDDGKFSYWGYDPRLMTFEQAAEYLENACQKRGLKIIPR